MHGLSKMCDSGDPQEFIWCTVLIKFIPKSFGEHFICNTFSVYGEIAGIVLLRDQVELSQGNALLTYKSPKSVDYLLKSGQVYIGGKCLLISPITNYIPTHFQFITHQVSCTEPCRTHELAIRRLLQLRSLLEDRNHPKDLYKVFAIYPNRLGFGTGDYIGRVPATND